MLCQTYEPNPTSVKGPLPESIFLLNDFKLLVDRSVRVSGIGKRIKLRLYEHSDFIILKLFAISSGMSTHDASEYLNERCKNALIEAGKYKLQIFRDNKRKRRIIPHQTDIDKFFRCLSETEIKTLFKIILDEINAYICRFIARDRTWTAIADNTKYPYYGMIDSNKHIKATYLPGTKHAWFFQGISVLSKNIHLYTDFHSLTKGVYRCMEVPSSIQWLKFCSLKIKKMLVDREFYRAALVDDLKKLNIRTLIPTKKYNWVKHRMTQFLNGRDSFISGTIFSQTAKKYPHQRGAVVRLVLIGHDGQSAHEVRELYRNGVLNFDEALRNLAGFFTNMKSWKNKRSWARYLVSEYKKRWWIETGFRMLNSVHKRFRSAHFSVLLAELHMRGWIYNTWQAFRHESLKNFHHMRDITMDAFLRRYTTDLEDLIVSKKLKEN